MTTPSSVDNLASPTVVVPKEASRHSILDRVAVIATAAEWALAAVLILTVSLYASLGQYARYAADDYTLSNNLHARGYLAEQVWEYLHWTGRFAYIALVDAALSLHEGFVHLLPGLIIVIWVVAIAAAVKMLVPTVSRVACVGLSAGIVFTTLHITPSPFLSVYWTAGSLEYTAPLVLGTVLIALLASRRQAGRLRIVAAGMIAFVAGGFNEAYAFCQLVGLVCMLLAMIVKPWPDWRRSRSVLVSSLVGSVLSAIVLAAAPGNYARFNVITGIIGTRPSLKQLPGVTIGFAWQFFNQVFVAHWGALLAVGGLAALIAMRTPSLSRTNPRRGLLQVLYVVGAAVVAIVGSFAPTAYVEARIAPIYGQIVPVFIGIGAVTVVAWACGRYIQALFERLADGSKASPMWRSIAPATASVALCGLIATVPIHTATSIWDSTGALNAYATTKDAQAALARAAGAAGQASVAVPSTSTGASLGVFSHPSYEEMLPDPKWWINVGEATYYGVGAIRVQG